MKPPTFALWTFAVDELTDFARAAIPTLMACYAERPALQIRTLAVLSHLEAQAERLDDQADTALADEVGGLCERLSTLLTPALPRLSRSQQLTYREILIICALARQA